MIRRLFGASAMALALSSAAFAQEQKPLSETCPNLTAEEIEAIENYKGQYAENAWYARAYCVSVEEAERRMEIQNRGAIGPRTEPGPRPDTAPDADPGSLQVLLHEKEPATFAGLWIQHQPTYGVAVAFTRDAAATLAKYTSDPIYIPVERPGPTLIELRTTQDRMVELLQQMGINWYGAGSDITKGTVEIELGQSADPIREAAARGEFDLPDYVVFKEPAPFPLPAPPIPAGDTRVKSFPQFANRTDGGISTLVGVPDVPARLALRDRCLWLYPEGEEPKIAVWEQHEALDLTDPDRVAVMNRFSGAKVYADSDVVLMGLQPSEVEPPKNIVGNEGCPGPYRVVRGIVPRQVWDQQQREEGIARRQAELGSKSAAQADYEADMARLADLQAWRSGLLAKRGDVVAAIWIDESQGTAHLFHTEAVTKEALVPAKLRNFVTTQVVPQGANALEEARADIAAQLENAGIEAQVVVEPLGGTIEVRPADIAALSQAAVENKLRFPALVRIVMENQSAIYQQDIPIRSDPEAIWYPLEAHPDFAAIRALVEDTPVPYFEPPAPGKTVSRQEMRKPSKAGSLQQTHFLIAYGLTLDEIVALRAAGFDPIEALEAMNGRQTIEKRAMTATDIVVAEPAGIDIADEGPDGFSSSVRWRVVEVLKGGAQPGDELRQRLASGMRTDEAGVTRYGQGMDDPMLLPGLPNSLAPSSRWVLHLSDALYRHSSYLQGGDGAARTEGKWYVNVPWMAPSLVDEDGMARPVSSYPEPVALEELRERIAPIQRALGFVQSGEKQ
ncbi:hypothetical protein [Croceicoccus gelatinilyticus]|uniref:hypothetical protein n=1 Tax=Croceicoccus gelatinilyticus TaxID=2835536 RepID=UPI001BD08176|nr:hypothetical protein [Croceicoccus gelatinilyticus]MBS7670932.1 hypothetical protein [Croceicoccus gelatinilyticus]